MTHRGLGSAGDSLAANCNRVSEACSNTHSSLLLLVSGIHNCTTAAVVCRWRCRPCGRASARSLGELCASSLLRPLCLSPWLQLSLDASESQMAELRGVYETYLRRMARLIANRNIAYSGVGKVRRWSSSPCRRLCQPAGVPATGRALPCCGGCRTRGHPPPGVDTVECTGWLLALLGLDS